MSDRITADEALARGYRWIFCGYNHKENCRLIAPISFMRSFNVRGTYSMADLEEAQRAALDHEPEPVADIPMVKQ